MRGDHLEYLEVNMKKIFIFFTDNIKLNLKRGRL